MDIVIPNPQDMVNMNRALMSYIMSYYSDHVIMEGETYVYLEASKHIMETACH